MPIQLTKTVETIIHTHTIGNVKVALIESGMFSMFARIRYVSGILLNALSRFFNISNRSLICAAA